MNDLWSADRRVLAEIVRQLEEDGLDFADCASAFEGAEVEPASGRRSIQRLVNAGMLDGQPVLSGDWVVKGVTERGLRESGVWPAPADQVAAQLIAALTQAAEDESEPEKRSKLRGAAASVAGIGKDVLTEVIASYAAKMAGT